MYHSPEQLVDECLQCYFKLIEEKRTEEAEQMLEQIAKVNPNNDMVRAILDNTVQPFVQRAKEYHKDGFLNEAIMCYTQSLAIKENPYVMASLAKVHADKLELDKAQEWLLNALDLEPEMSSAHIELAYVYYLMGEPKKAWEHYEYRLRHFPQMIEYMALFGSYYKWNGRDSLEGKKLGVFCEGGYGDIIQMLRYFEKLKELKCHVIAYCPKPLASLLQPYVDEVSDKSYGFDYHVSSMSLPYLLQEYVPIDAGPITLPETKNIEGTGNLKVGISWQGSRNHPNDKNRSCDFNYFKHLMEVPGIDWYCLHKETGNIPNLIYSELDDFLDTAMLVNAMDLVITIDTAVLHLAGALHIKAYGLITHRPHFLWGLEKTTPWYESIELIRQTSPGDWSNVFKEVRDKLNELK